MTSLLSGAYAAYSDFIEKNHVPETKDYFLMGSPIPIALILISYNYFITTLGPNLMKNRRPFELRKPMIVYNAVQVLVNIHIVYEAAINAWLTGKSGWVCRPQGEPDMEFANLCRRVIYTYFITKVMDLTDTIFMVLRKKQNQVSFLHQYHHTGMCIASWLAVAVLPAEQGATFPVFFGTINCTVHIIMYAYYFLSIFYPSLKNSSFKRRITEMQLAQFVITCLHGITGLLDTSCVFPRWALWMYVPQDMFMFALFWDFYVKAYLKPKAKAKKAESTHEADAKKLH